MKVNNRLSKKNKQCRTSSAFFSSVYLCTDERREKIDFVIFFFLFIDFNPTFEYEDQQLIHEYIYSNLLIVGLS